MRDTRVPEQQCPSCGCKLNAMCDLEGEAVPNDGNRPFTVCIECAEVLVVEPDFSLRLLDADDMDELPADFLQELKTLQERILKVNATRVRHDRGGWSGKL
jgi:hypothetical protein